MVLPAEKRGVQGLGTGGTGVGDCACPTSGNAANTEVQINILLTLLDTFIEIASARDSYCESWAQVLEVACLRRV